METRRIQYKCDDARVSNLDTSVYRQDLRVSPYHQQSNTSHELGTLRW
jgi:hypothetical protein